MEYNQVKGRGDHDTTESEQQRNETPDERLLRTSKKRLRMAIEASHQMRSEAADDMRFSFGEQWPDDIRRQRDLERRPCLTINKTNTFIRQVVNNMRQQRARIKVHPISDGADKKRANVIEGLMRHIEYSSNAEVAYDIAADSQVRMGWGYIRISARYVKEDSFDQELYIDPIRNPFAVYFDPSTRSADGSDAEWVLITSQIKRDEFRKMYPDADPVDMKDLGQGDEKPLWANKHEITIAEYWYVDAKHEPLYKLSDGSHKFKSDMPSEESLAYAGLHIVDERESIKKQIKWAKVTARNILEEGVWPGRYLPIIPVYGMKSVIQGKTILYGMTRDLKDPQRMFNFWRTAEAELVALAPKAPWLVAEGQIEGYEDIWNSANIRSWAFLPYKPMVDDGNTPVPPPMRQQPQQIPAASVNAAMAASEDMKAVAGMFDPALGAEGNETSGVMVSKRQGQSDLSNYHFYDNLTRMIACVGRNLLDLIPHYYDTERVLRIIGEDGKPDAVTINQKKLDPTGTITEVLNDLSIGRYDIVMETGPGYSTRRQEGTEAMLKMAQTDPNIMQVAGDIIARRMDFPGSDLVADRLEAANPLAQQMNKLPEDLPEEIKGQVAGMQAQLAQAQQQLQQLQKEKDAHLFGEQVRQQGHMQRAELAANTKIHDTTTRNERAKEDTQMKALATMMPALIKHGLDATKFFHSLESSVRQDFENQPQQPDFEDQQLQQSFNQQMQPQQPQPQQPAPPQQ